MQFSNKDGELRLYEAGASNYYVSVLFTNADLTFPLGRPKVEEIMTLDRGNYDQNASYREGPDDVILEPLPVTFSGMLDDTGNTNVLVALLSGATQITSNNGALNDLALMLTTKGTTTLNIGSTAISTVLFADSSKIAYNMEVLWDTAGSDYGFKLTEIYFPPDQQTINETADGVTLTMNGLFYGSAVTQTTFTSGTSV